MGRFDRITASSRSLPCLSASLIAFAPAAALAGTTLTLPSSNSIAFDGRALQITNTLSSLGAGHLPPTAIAGIGSGKAETTRVARLEAAVARLAKAAQPVQQAALAGSR